MDAAGSLRHRVTILSSSTTPDGIGGSKRTPVTLGTVWAQVTPMKGGGNGETNTADGLRARTQILVTIRYPSFTVDQSMRVSWNGRVWVIQRIIQRDLITRWLDLTCLEGE